MKLIIDLPEKVVTAIQNGEDYRYDIHTSIAQGIPYAERPQGEWILIRDKKWGDNVKCPFCKKELAGTDLNFCCKCGAKLIGSEKMNGGAV